MITQLLPAADPATIGPAVNLLAAGEVVALPTETVYGLAADALRAEAAAKIFEAKERPFFDPLIVHLPSRHWLEKIATVPERSKVLVDALIEKFWPGPLTLVLPRQKIVPDLVTAGLDTVAVRMSSHPVFQNVIERFGKPLAAPSANRFGRISPTAAGHVFAELNNRIPLIVDAGTTQHGIESTILAVEGGELRLLRAGPITPEEIGGVWQSVCKRQKFAPTEKDVNAFFEKLGVSFRAMLRGAHDTRIEAPGQLQSHYAPRTPLRLLALGAHARVYEKVRAGYLAWESAPKENCFCAIEILSESGDFREAAATFVRKAAQIGRRETRRDFRGLRAGARAGHCDYGSFAQSCRPKFMSDSDRKFSAKSAGVVGIAVMCSRVLGLVRELVFAALFGAGFKMDAFVAAFRAPNLLRDLFAEGALSTAFVTTFSKKIATEGDESAWKLANKVATLTVIFMSFVTLLGIIFAPQLMFLLAHGFEAEPGKFQLAVLLTRIMFPFILMVSLSALVMGMLNAKHVFGMPALASSFFNLGSIVGGAALGWLMDPHFGTRSLIGLSIGTLIGGFLQLVVQFPALRKVRFRFRPDFVWRDEGVRQVLLLMGPAVIAASAVQVNVMVNGNFASHLGNGPVSWLNYAFRLMQLPIGIFGVALGTVTLPAISRSAAMGDTAQLRSTLAHALKLAFLLTIPCAIGLIFFSEPIISLIFQRGRFTFDSTLQTAAALRFYAIGLVAYAGIKVLAPAFYAIDKRYAPMLVSFFSIATNWYLNQLFTFKLGYGHRGLALSTGFVASINFVILFLMMSHHVKGLEAFSLFKTIFKILLASSLLAAVCSLSRKVALRESRDDALFAEALGSADDHRRRGRGFFRRGLLPKSGRSA